MRNKILLIMICLSFLGGAVEADLSLEPYDYTFVVSSPFRRYFAVQTLYDWKEDEGSMGLKGRFQMIEGSSGKVLWSSEKILGLQRAIFIPDDPDYTVMADTRIPSKAISGPRYENLSKSPKKIQDKNLSSVAVRFFKRGKQISEYTLEELAIKPESIQLSVSHLIFFDAEDERSVEENWEIGSMWKLRNPNFDVKTNTMNLTCLDGKIRRFDYQTGKLIDKDYKHPKQKESDGGKVNDPLAK